MVGPRRFQKGMYTNLPVNLPEGFRGMNAKMVTMEAELKSEIMGVKSELKLISGKLTWYSQPYAQYATLIMRYSYDYYRFLFGLSKTTQFGISLLTVNLRSILWFLDRTQIKILLRKNRIWYCLPNR